MLNSGKKIRTLRDKKYKYSNSCVVLVYGEAEAGVAIPFHR
jgi:hypothetical protein